jgi:predicted DNA-binding protein
MSTRTTKVYSITMPPELGRQAEQLAKRESRTMSELMREAFRVYQRQAEDRRLLADPSRRRNLADLKEALEALRTDAARTGASNMTMRQIDAEIGAARNARARKKR